MKVAIHQPCYLPWLGLMQKASESDVFVFMDDAQYSKSEPFSYNDIKTPQGRMRLRVPVIYRFGDPINKTRPNYEVGWVEHHLKALRMNYAKAKNFESAYDAISRALNKKYDTLSSLNIELTLILFSMLGIKPKTLCASELDVKTKKEQRVIDICKKLDADTYISGVGASAYQSDEHFRQNGISLVYSKFEAKPYRQMFGQFEPNLSSVDYLMNCGGNA